MSKSEARRQKQLAKKKARREGKRSQLARQNSDNPLVRLANAETWPVLEALVPEELWESGMGDLILARKMADGRIAFAIFLVDTYCLGVKDAFWRILPASDYREVVDEIERKHGALNPVPPEYFVKLVYGAVDYAQSFGFPSHADYRHARLLLQGIDPSSCSDTFEFGKDGGPFYIAGPHDSPAKINWIMHRLDEVGGHFFVPMDPTQGIGTTERAWIEDIGVDEPDYSELRGQ